jgi:hypothetical protein
LSARIVIIGERPTGTSGGGLAAEVFRRRTEYATQGSQTGAPPEQEANDPYPVAISRLASLNNFIDYVLLNVFAGNEDWPSDSRVRV